MTNFILFAIISATQFWNFLQISYSNFIDIWSSNEQENIQENLCLFNERMHVIQPWNVLHFHLHSCVSSAHALFIWKQGQKS